jgi:PhnB protein
MKLQTYLNYGGNCAEAFRFYQEHLGGKIGMMMTHEQAPDQSQVEPEWAKAVLYGNITIGDTVLAASDIPPDHFKPMRNVYLSLGVDSDAEAERIYELLSKDGEIFMSMQETFFASRFAQLRDRFGTSWMILHERPMPNP